MQRRLKKIIKTRVEEHVKSRKGVSNDIIRNFCSRVCGNDFKGVFTADRIDLGIACLNNFIIVVNLDKRGSEDVGHFITIVGSAKNVLYIDPYGLPCWQKDVTRFLNACRRSIVYNRKQIQDFMSVYCGVYAMLFASYFGINPPFKLHFKKKKLQDNDKLCMQYLHRILKYW